MISIKLLFFKNVVRFCYKVEKDSEKVQVYSEDEMQVYLTAIPQ